MKPILYIQFPVKIESSIANMIMRLAKSLKERFANEYELIISPTGSDIKIRSEGTVVNLNIDANTNFDELLKKLEENKNG